MHNAIDTLSTRVVVVTADEKDREIALLNLPSVPPIGAEIDINRQFAIGSGEVRLDHVGRFRVVRLVYRVVDDRSAMSGSSQVIVWAYVDPIPNE
jgi:hypothetical protein